MNTTITISVPTSNDMHQLGACVAGLVHGGDVILLSGPLGAGKTTFAQGFGTGLGISEPIVSPTFTIARELRGQFTDGRPAHVIHVDAYRLGGTAYAPGQNTADRLLDELESLGLDEELEQTGDDTVVLMEWGEQMAAALAPQRLEIHIDRPLPNVTEQSSQKSEQMLDSHNERQLGNKSKKQFTEPDASTSNGIRTVTFIPCGGDWSERLSTWNRTQ